MCIYRKCETIIKSVCVLVTQRERLENKTEETGNFCFPTGLYKMTLNLLQYHENNAFSWFAKLQFYITHITSA